jgi:predicted Zn-dependent peptidase
MIKKGITKVELATFKGNAKGNMLIESQDIVYQTRYIGEEMIFSQSDNIKIIPYRNVFEKFIAPLTLLDIRRVIQRYFTKENMCVSILSEDLPSLETLKRECDKII